MVDARAWQVVPMVVKACSTKRKLENAMNCWYRQQYLSQFNILIDEDSFKWAEWGSLSLCLYI